MWGVERRHVIGQRDRLPILLVAVVLAALASVGRVMGPCIVFRLAKRSIPGCVPAWSADRAPPVGSGIA